MLDGRVHKRAVSKEVSLLVSAKWRDPAIHLCVSKSRQHDSWYAIRLYCHADFISCSTGNAVTMWCWMMKRMKGDKK